MIRSCILPPSFLKLYGRRQKIEEGGDSAILEKGRLSFLEDRKKLLTNGGHFWRSINGALALRPSNFRKNSANCAIHLTQINTRMVLNASHIHTYVCDKQEESGWVQLVNLQETCEASMHSVHSFTWELKNVSAGSDANAQGRD
ncbi:hypothetical protein VNO77_08911 [Canavalia gladiata]|uniref:Uncharacterized protein n=1 Tax=Canavalia gladiata TaxID=3824 RepID=A0AAN9MEB5_CANGL